MKTILIEEPGKVVIEEHEKPVRKPGEVLLKILYGGICGSIRKEKRCFKRK